MPGRVFTVEFKPKVVGEIERKEKTIAQVCREHQLADRLENNMLTMLLSCR